MEADSDSKLDSKVRLYDVNSMIVMSNKRPPSIARQILHNESRQANEREAKTAGDSKRKQRGMRRVKNRDVDPRRPELLRQEVHHHALQMPVLEVVLPVPASEAGFDAAECCVISMCDMIWSTIL